MQPRPETTLTTMTFRMVGAMTAAAFEEVRAEWEERDRRRWPWQRDEVYLRGVEAWRNGGAVETAAD